MTTLWANGNAQGRLVGGEHFVRLSDAAELAAAITRRRLLTFRSRQDYSSHVFSGANVRRTTLADSTGLPFERFRTALGVSLLAPPTQPPPRPLSMEWLWPLADADAGKKIVANNPQAGEVGLFAKLNGTGGWTDSTLVGGATAVHAVHFNELRQTAEWLTRGRWRLPVYLGGGMFSALPDTDWIGGYIGNDSYDELRTLGIAMLNTTDSSSDVLGLSDVTFRSTSGMEVIADAACTVEVWRCLRTIDYDTDRPTWNDYRTGEAWSQPGGMGAGDATYLGSVTLAAGVWGFVCGSVFAQALTAMLAGAPSNFLFRRSDIGGSAVCLNATLRAEFDLNQ